MEKPPAPAAARKVEFARPVRETLANGLTVITIRRTGIPLVSARLLIRSGAEIDPPEMAGLADITAALLTKGTETRTAPEIANAIESLGAGIETGSKWDSSFVQINTLSAQLPQALDLLADLVRHPAFKDEEIERLRKQMLDDLSVSLAEPGTIARLAAAKLIFGRLPYGHSATGTPESIARANREAIVHLHRTFYRPSNAILVLSGDITAQDALELSKKTLGEWANPAESLPVPDAAEPQQQERRVVLIDMPEAGQAAVLLGKPGIRREDPDYFDGEVANAILGGGYSSRLNEEIRVKRGLTYGASSSLDARKQIGPFLAFAQTKNQSAAQVGSLMITELEKLSSTPVGASELDTRKAALLGEFARHLETNDGFGAMVGSMEIHGLPLDSANTFSAGIQSVTAERVQTFARNHLRPESATLVLVGNTAKFRDAASRAFQKIEVIPQAKLDLNEPSLRRQDGGTKSTKP
jgi:zinc protease